MRPVALSPDGREQVLHHLRPGETFAEAAVFMPRGYPAYAEALAKSRAALLPKAEFIDLLRPEALAQAIAVRRQQATLRMQPGYDHSYFFVSTFMEDHVAFHAEAMG